MMDKSWMTLRQRLGKQYRDGASAFVEFAMTKTSNNGTIRCPCNECMNRYWHSGEVVNNHLIRHGIMESYKNWVYHGESFPECQTHVSDDESDNEMTDNEEEDGDELPDLMEDYCRGAYMNRDWGDQIQVRRLMVRRRRRCETLKNCWWLHNVRCTQAARSILC